MKKTYEAPEIEIEKYSITTNVFTTVSGGGWEDDNYDDDF